MDGRVQLFATYDQWARKRGIAAGTAEYLRIKVGTRYRQTLRNFY